jgi:dsRNA-specific ribonuclease
VEAPADNLVLRVERLEERLGYTFTNKWLALQALTHPSSSREPRHTASGGLVRLADYQRLEFFGDALLDYVVVAQAFHDTEGEAAGIEEVQAVKQAVVSNDHLAQRAVEWLQLHRLVFMSDLELRRAINAFASLPEAGQREHGGPKALADVMEALVAAVFFDCGGRFAVVHQVFHEKLRHEKAAAGADGGSARPPAVDFTLDKLLQSGKPVDVGRLRERFPDVMGLCADLL